jgi:hypothetical protein
MVAPIALALLLAQAGPATAPSQCDSLRVAMPASLTGWSDAGALGAIGKAFTVAAADPTTIRGLRIGEVTRSGGAALVPFEVDSDATYRVAVSDKAWVDVVAGNSVVKSTAHGHGPACSGISKVVDFPLKRGRYALHLTGISAPSVKVLIARA